MPPASGAVDHSAESAYSDPGAFAPLLDEVDPTVVAVSAMARNVVAHYRGQASELPASSRDDISLRWIDAILDTDQRRHRSALTVERPLRERVQGCCRDHTLLAVSALRHHGVPARSRVGFAMYLSPTWNHDHVIVEAWMGGRWRRFDPELAAPVAGLADPTDVPDGPQSAFLTSSRVWLAHRAGSIDVTRFGVAEGLGLGGEWFVHAYVIAEVAHRLGDELLLWDRWGAMRSDSARLTPDALLLVDEVARLAVAADDGDVAAERELHERYRDDERLHPGSRVVSQSPNGGLFQVDLSTRTTSQIDAGT